MTVSYALHLQTELAPEAVLLALFDTRKTEKVSEGVYYTRGNVYLAHSRRTEPRLQQQFETNFGIKPDVSVPFFPDGVSSVQTALDKLAEAVSRWFNLYVGDVLLTANNREMVLLRVNNKVHINETHEFWTQSRLNRIKS